MIRISSGQKMFGVPGRSGSVVSRNPLAMRIAKAMIAGTLSVLPLATMGCSRPPPALFIPAHRGLEMEPVDFDKSLLTKYLPSYNPKFKQQNFYFPFTIYYSCRNDLTSARIQLSAERQGVRLNLPEVTYNTPEESLIRVHWEYVCGPFVGHSLDLVVGDNKIYVDATLPEIKRDPHPTRAGLRFINENILTPLRQSDLSLPKFFYELDGKIQDILKKF